MRAPLIACIGAARLDRHGVLHRPLVRGTTNTAAVFTGCGGVPRNVAMNLGPTRGLDLLAAVSTESERPTAPDLSPEALHARA